MIKMNKIALAAAVALSSVSGAAMAKQKVCVFDLLGAQGDAFSMMKDYALFAAKSGVQLELAPYTSESVALADLKAGQCDAALMTGLRGRDLNLFTGSLDSIGAIPSYTILQKVYATLTSPAVAGLMSKNGYEVAGMAPGGAAYLFVNDRQINTVAKLSGKKIASFDYDKSQAKMIQKVGAQPVSADITNFGAKFNNGSVDIIAAPAVAYKPLELFKGLGTKGAIVRFPIVQLSFQVFIKKDKFPADFGQKSREYWATQFDRAMSIVKKSEKDVPAAAWMDLPEADKDKYVVLMRDSRISLTNDGLYDKTMMKVLKKSRCAVNAGDAECAQNLE